MEVALTGGTGFIGANLARHLLQRGDRVRCLVRTPGPTLEGLDVALLNPPLRDEPAAIDALARALEGCEGVYHVAGIFDPSPGGVDRMFQVHVGATHALLKACALAGVRRLVYCSSSVTVGYGPRTQPGNEDSALDPDEIYGRNNPLRAYHDSKLEGEAVALSFPGVQGVVVNPDFILGAWDVKPTSGQLVVAMARRFVPVYPRGGKCFQDADDCAAGHALAMERGQPGRRYLLGNENLSYRQFMGIVAEVVGRRPPLLPLPDLAVSVAGRLGQGLSRIDAHRFAGLDPKVLRSMQQDRYRSGARSWAELGVPRTPIRVAVEKALRWFRERGYCP
jgi:dihydroflavonol-4-reductase